MKVITGILTPTSGEVHVNGKISALLELGAGFNPEYTGIENIYLYGSMLGLEKEEVDTKIDSIIEFADIGEFVNQPVKSYSSGMFVRLAFSCAVSVDPDILIVDEALSVGDVRFQQKCYRKIREFKENGTVLFVSHDLGAISNFCDRVIWFNDGQIYKEGTPDEIIDEYHAYMTYDAELSDLNDAEHSYEDDENVSSTFSTQSQVFGEMGAVIKYAELLNQKGKTSTIISGGEKVELRVTLDTKVDLSMPILGFVLKDRLGNSILIVNSETENIRMSPLTKDKTYKFCWTFEFPMIRDGVYSLDLAIANGTYEQHIQHHWINDALLIDVRNKKSYSYAQGFCVLDKIRLDVESS